MNGSRDFHILIQLRRECRRRTGWSKPSLLFQCSRARALFNGIVNGRALQSSPLGSAPGKKRFNPRPRRMLAMPLYVSILTPAQEIYSIDVSTLARTNASRCAASPVSILARGRLNSFGKELFHDFVSILAPMDKYDIGKWFQSSRGRQALRTCRPEHKSFNPRPRAGATDGTVTASSTSRFNPRQRAGAIHEKSSLRPDLVSILARARRARALYHCNKMNPFNIFSCLREPIANIKTVLEFIMVV